MNRTRTFLVFGLLFVAFTLYNQWMADYHPPQPTTTAQASSDSTAPGASVPTTSAPEAAADTAPVGNLATTADKATTGQIITVTTDLLKVSIDTRGGTLVGATLLKYPVKLGSSDDVALLNNAPKHFYEAQSGLIGAAGAAAPSHQSLFKAQKTAYTLQPGKDSIDVKLTWTSAAGVTVTKVYTFKRGSYVVNMTQDVANHGSAAWKGYPYRQLERVVPPEPTYDNFLRKYSDVSRYSFFGAAWYGPDDNFNKIKFDDIEDHPLRSTDNPHGYPVKGGWIAMEQAYFVGAWLPKSGETNVLSTAKIGDGDSARYLIRSIGPLLTVAPGKTASDSARLFLGPKVPDILSSVAPNFDLALNYGMMTIVARPLHWLLAKLEAVTGNWGWAIILLVLLINAACYKLYAMQYRSSARMRKLKPRMDALKERYGDDRQKLQRATMELYKKEKVNPLSGCLPVLITIPVFFGLYELLRESVELRQAPFIGWIQDLSAADPYFVLPIIYGVVMLIQSLTMPLTPGMDGTQQKMMRFMPVAFAAFFAFFPAGLALYYSVSGICRLLIQWWVYHKVDQEEARKNLAKAQ